MPVVPGRPGQITPIPSAPKVDPTMLMMAMATMHEQGRLFEKPSPTNEETRLKSRGVSGTYEKDLDIPNSLNQEKAKDVQSNPA